MNSVRIPAGVVNLRHLHPQVTARALGGITWTVSPSAPSSPNKNDLWTNEANSYQLSQWTGSQWFAVPVNAGSLTGENFMISANGQYHYASPPAFTTWGFESGLAGWTATNASPSPSPAWANSGSYSALLTYMSGTSWSFESPQQAVQVGNQVYVSATVNAPQALGAVGLQLAWYNSVGTLLSTSSQATAALPANTPTQLTYNAAPPSSAAFVVIIVQDAETSVTGYQLYVDDVYIAGQLAVATAPAAGSDPLGNAHPPGLYTAGTYGTGVTMSTGNSLEFQPGNTGVTAQGSGGTRQLGTGLWSPLMTGGTAYEDLSGVLLFSSKQGSSATGGGVLAYTPGSGGIYQAQLSWGAGGVTIGAPLTLDDAVTIDGAVTLSGGAVSPDSTLSGGIIIAQTDILFTSQSNPTTPSRICKVWGIPAGDPVGGTWYRLSMPLIGTWEAIPLNFQIAAFSQTLGGLTIGGSLMTAGTSFVGDLTATLIITQTGSSGILTGSIKVNLGPASNNQLPLDGANGTSGFVGVSVAEPVSGIGGSGSSMTVQAWFSSSNSSQSIEGLGSLFERIDGG